VIDASQAALLISAEEQRSAAMSAVVGQQADAAVGIAEGDQLLAKEHHS